MKILILDDNREQAEALADYARSHGHVVQVYDAPTEALRGLREGFRPDVILADIHLRGPLTGSEFVRKMVPPGNAPPPIPVVAITAAGQKPSELPDSVPILFKPLDPDLILEALTGVVEAHH